MNLDHCFIPPKFTFPQFNSADKEQEQILNRDRVSAVNVTKQEPPFADVDIKNKNSGKD